MSVTKISPEELEERRVYILNARNLLIGVWNPSTNGFIGIRHKLGDVYLFTEREYGQLGTAVAVSALDAFAPQEIKLKEHLGSIAERSKRPVYFERDTPSEQVGKWYYSDDKSPIHDEYPVSVSNKLLFNFLKPYHDEALKVRIQNF